MQNSNFGSSAAKAPFATQIIKNKLYSTDISRVLISTFNWYFMLDWAYVNKIKLILKKSSSYIKQKFSELEAVGTIFLNA